MENSKRKTIIKQNDITLIAILTTILFTQEQLLTFIPNFQLTVFLLVLYSKKLGFIRSTIICFIHVILDSIVMSSFNILFVPFMLIGWLIIPISINTIFKKVESDIILAFLGILFSLLYSWIYIIPNCFLMNVGFVAYLMADIVWEILLATSSFISILLLYTPCAKLFDKLKLSKEISK